MSVSAVSSSDLTSVYQAFQELEPHMDDVRRFEDLKLTNRPLYEKLDAKLSPLVQEALNQVEDALQKRNFFTEEFKAQVAQVRDLAIGYKEAHQQSTRIYYEIRDLLNAVAESQNRKSCLGPMLQMSAILQECLEIKSTRSFESQCVTWFYSNNPDVSNAEKAVNKKIAAAFDRIVIAASGGEDKALIESMEAFANVYEKSLPYTIKEDESFLKTMVKMKQAFEDLKKKSECRWPHIAASLNKAPALQSA